MPNFVPSALIGVSHETRANADPDENCVFSGAMSPRPIGLNQSAVA